MPIWAKAFGQAAHHGPSRGCDAQLYIASRGYQWRMLPKDFPPFTPVQAHFYEWRATMEAREPEGQ
ncbi:transposase [Rhizobium leguminosarum]|nr:transposase [Rhizobium leguminosarum]